LFSTKTDDFQGWIDHVWVSEGADVASLSSLSHLSLSPLSRLSLS
jgi:mRNA deadenylase 3'-5' endonuclease subunit Ccr4